MITALYNFARQMKDINNRLSWAYSSFRSSHYIRHNARRLEHLSSLRLDLNNKSVLELGAGIGDHTTFFLDRKCDVVTLEAREENCIILNHEIDAYLGYLESQQIVEVHQIDIDTFVPEPEDNNTFDIVYSYGLLYHLKNPLQALNFMSSRTHSLLLLETCVSFGDEQLINNVPENQESPTQSNQGTGCRPTRTWIMNQLKVLFEFVYVPKTQPWHEEFPIDWTITPEKSNRLTRAVFIGSRTPLDNDLLLDYLPNKQTR